jgi:Dyp-type peroxidase family
VLETGSFGGYEPFGFRDGISQPVLEGLSKAAGAAETIRFGEFVLGYPNEYGLLTDRPLVERSADPRALLPTDPGGSGRADLGMNGTYLVLRQLEQDVPGFWRFVDRAARDGASSADPARRAWLAAKLVGRWPGGAPLVLAPDADDPALATANDFTYYAPDVRGARCPIGAHIRRANPRDSLDPKPGSADSLAINHRHRLLRRGRAYGTPITVEEALAGGAAAAAPRGLHFACLNASIARQFEFVQSTWVANPKFAGLYDDADPLLGGAGPYGRTFTAPTDGVRRRLTGLPQFVSVRGGAYLFMPGIAAVRWLAVLAG